MREEKNEIKVKPQEEILLDILKFISNKIKMGFCSSAQTKDGQCELSLFFNQPDVGDNIILELNSEEFKKQFPSIKIDPNGKIIKIKIE